MTEGLVAQFGEHVFGKAWDYDFATTCDGNDRGCRAVNRSRAALSDWLQCAPCRVGASNRQARFLAGIERTGALAADEPPATGDDAAAAARDAPLAPREARLLEAARANLERCARAPRYSVNAADAAEPSPARFSSLSLSR